MRDLDFKYLKRQGYDSALVMSGEFKGMQACFAEHQPKVMLCALYVTQFKSCSSDLCQVQAIINSLGRIEKTYSFPPTAKILEVLSLKIGEI
ncbi:hypothetical protein NPIL_155451 [Nephila pilipes]|uniref:Uncharacterized protein n=1 Tax=Nephila pilipes TaxID=299642 RepID=A0A8X6MXJ4_NEPPI|nr:hypothetical protein NPIL_155451 [Nephila pilipes]